MFRLFGAEFGGQISWLLPAALITLAAMLWWTRRAARSDKTRAAALLWGGWVLVTGLVFSYMAGIIHPYYMVALAPGIAALIGIGAAAAWRTRLGPGNRAARVVTAAAVVMTAVWSYVLLDRTPDWLPWLRWLVLVGGVAGGGAVLVSPWLAGLARTAGWRRGRNALFLVPAGLAMVAGLAGPAAYALDTINSAHTGAIPSAGPQTDGFGGPGGFAGRPGGFAGRGFSRGGFPGGRAGQFGSGSSGSGQAGTGTGGIPGAAGSPGASGNGNFPGPAGGFPGRGAGAFDGRGAGGFGGGLGGSTQVSSALVKLLEQDASRYKWVAATEGSEAAAPIELATGDAVMAIGGFNGTDPWPTLKVFEELVAKHEVHYYVGQGSESFGGGQGSSAIASWVAAHFAKQTVGGQTVYDLTKPES